MIHVDLFCDVNPGPRHSSIFSLLVVDEQIIYFSAGTNDVGLQGYKQDLWFMDLSASSLVLELLDPQRQVYAIENVMHYSNTSILFSARYEEWSKGLRNELWISPDGFAPPYPITDDDSSEFGTQPRFLQEFNGELFFQNTANESLYFTDGTSKGTDFYAHRYGAVGPFHLLQGSGNENLLLYTVKRIKVESNSYSRSVRDVWVTRGDTQDVQLLFEDVDLLSYKFSLHGFDFFTSWNSRRKATLWSTNGTQVNELLLMEDDPFVIEASSLLPDGRVLLSLDKGQLALFDGSVEGLELVYQFLPFSNYSLRAPTASRFSSVFNSTMVFFLVEKDNVALWVCNVTRSQAPSFSLLQHFSGRKLVGYNFGAEKAEVLDLPNDQVLFILHNDTSDELWLTDRTINGSRLLRTFQRRFTTIGLGHVGALTLFNSSTVLFRGCDADHGYELWRVTFGTSFVKPTISMDDSVVIPTAVPSLELTYSSQSPLKSDVPANNPLERSPQSSVESSRPISSPQTSAAMAAGGMRSLQSCTLVAWISWRILFFLRFF